MKVHIEEPGNKKEEMMLQIAVEENTLQEIEKTTIEEEN